MEDEIAVWLRAQAEADLARAEKAAGVFMDNPHTEAARAESVLAVLDLYERQAAKSGESALQEDRAWTLEPVVRLLAYGYRHREGWQDGWKP